MFAIAILGIGLVSLAALMAAMLATTDRSRYMSTAGLLASEKLEELNRLPADDPQIAITSGNSAGSLTADSGPVTIGAATLSYYDQVIISSGNGSVSTTYTASNGNGYFTQSQTPDAGTKDGNTTVSLPTLTADATTYKRRWLIEQNVAGPPALPAGTRRITVVVSLVDSSGNLSKIRPVSFQLSMVRQ